MAQTYDNKNTLVAFKNERKTKDTHADYAGTFTDSQGREYFLDIWVKDGKKGKFLSGRVKLKTRQQQDPDDLP